MVCKTSRFNPILVIRHRHKVGVELLLGLPKPFLFCRRFFTRASLIRFNRGASKFLCRCLLTQQEISNLNLPSDWGRAGDIFILNSNVTSRVLLVEGVYFRVIKLLAHPVYTHYIWTLVHRAQLVMVFNDLNNKPVVFILLYTSVKELRLNYRGKHYTKGNAHDNIWATLDYIHMVYTIKVKA